MDVTAPAGPRALTGTCAVLVWRLLHPPAARP